MPIYTHTGDEGSSLLPGAGGQGGQRGTGVPPVSSRVPKDHPLLAALGEIDELNSVVGLCLAEAAKPHRRAKRTEERGRDVPEGQDARATVIRILTQVQHELLCAGSITATVGTGREPSVALDGAAPERMERDIDAIWATLPELTRFILPGGCELAARLHLARTVCRRAERAVVPVLVGCAGLPPRGSGPKGQVLHTQRPGEREDTPKQTALGGATIVLKYINRLSDLLFALARLANHDAGVGDVIWEKKNAGP